MVEADLLQAQPEDPAEHMSVMAEETVALAATWPHNLEVAVVAQVDIPAMEAKVEIMVLLVVLVMQAPDPAVAVAVAADMDQVKAIMIMVQAAVA